MSLSSYLLKVDWVRFMERKRAMSLYFAFMEVERQPLMEATGFSFRHHLYLYRDGTGIHFRSKRELAACAQHFRCLIEAGDPRLREWARHGREANERAEALIRLAKGRTLGRYPLAAYERAYEVLQEILLFSVTIPYLVLSSISDDVESGSATEAESRTLTLFEPLRAVSVYPEIEGGVMPVFWNSIAEQIGLGNAELASGLTFEEILDFLRTGSSVPESLLKQRNEWSLFWMDPNAEKIMFSFDRSDSDAISALSDEGATELPEVREVRGRTANKGKAKGRVCLVNTPQDVKKVRPGDVVVSVSTNPTLMPALRICSAIVTDEGGIMCHAAIVSRELHVPCVIGTKVATRQLREGDVVEVDATNGRVVVCD